MRILSIIILWLIPHLVSAENYRIGVILPLTGSAAREEAALTNAIELYVNQFNANGGINGKKLEILLYDSQESVEHSKQIAHEITKNDSILAVIGYRRAATALPSAKILGDAHIPLISPYMSSPEYLHINPWTFSMNAPDTFRGSFMAVYIKEVLKKDNILLIYNEGDQGDTLRDSFLSKAQRIGLTVKKVLATDSGEQRLPDNWVKNNLPNTEENKSIGMVATIVSTETGLSLLPQLRDNHINAPVIAPDTWADSRFFRELSEQYTQNVYLTSSFIWEIANKKAADFANTYLHTYENLTASENMQASTKYYRHPPVVAAMAYDAIFLISKAIESLVNQKNPPKNTKEMRTGIRDYLMQLDWQHAVEGVTGLLFFQNVRDKTSAYMDQYEAFLAKRALEPPEKRQGKPDNLQLSEDENIVSESNHVSYTPLRDIYVSVMKDGRFKVADVQLLQPREEYILRQLPRRVERRELLISDRIPYHIVNVVFVGMDIVRIEDINIRDMSWDVDLFIWFKWRDDHLTQEIDHIGLINEISSSSQILNENLQQPTKYRAYRKRLKLEAYYDLSIFPFDIQILPLSIAHAHLHSMQLMLVLDERHMDNSQIEDIKPHEWTYLGKNAYSDLYRYTSTFGNPSYRMGKNYKSPIYFSTINLDIGVKRILQPYLYTFFLPLSILLGIILLVIWIPLDQFSPRISASISGLVGILVYHMAQKSAFPKVGYTTIADYYFLAAYFFVVVLIIFIIYSQLLWAKGHKVKAVVWNRRFGLSAILVVVTAYSIITVIAIYLEQAYMFTD
jgi:branched-chain amino acid transport system substrate-binding protein